MLMRFFIYIGLMCLTLPSNAIILGKSNTPDKLRFNTVYLQSDYYDGSADSYYYLGCNATRISQRWFLTSVVCALGWGGFENPDTGVILKGIDEIQEFYEFETVSRVVTHPNYNQNTIAYNLALVRVDGYSETLCASQDLDAYVEERCKYVDKIAPPILLDIELDDLVGRLGTAVSWSFDKQTGFAEEPNDKGLRNGTMKIYDGSLCEGIYGTTYFRDKEHICTKGYERDYRLCYSDTGSALYIEEEFGNDILIGTAPYWDSECASQHTISVYQRISENIDWIKSVVGAKNLRLASEYYREQKIREDNEIFLLIAPLL